MKILQKDEKEQNKLIRRKISATLDTYYVLKKYIFKLNIRDRQRKRARESEIQRGV